MLSRIERLQQKMTTEAYLVEDSVNLYYLTGLQLSAGSLLIKKNQATLFVDGRYFEVAKEHSPTEVRSSEEDFVKTVKELGFDRDRTCYRRYEELKEKGVRVVPCSDLTAELRIIKDDGEKEKLRQAAALGVEGFYYAKSLLKEGISEIEVAHELAIFWMRKGGEGVAFDPIVAFGPNSSMPHYHPTDCKLRKGDLVLIDIGVTLGHYHSDMTRVHFFGDVEEELHNIHKVVRQAQQKALDLCKAGVAIGGLDEVARGHIESAGYALPHSLGHGIGLEVHEAPAVRNKGAFKETPLRAGMVITIEPGIYLPHKGGVRLEDTVIVTESGCENLTPAPYK